VQSGMGVLACAAADGALEATVDALLARRCQAARLGEPGEAGTRALLDEVLAATAAAVPGLQQLLLRPLRGLLQRQARAAQAAGQAVVARTRHGCRVCCDRRCSASRGSVQRQPACIGGVGPGGVPACPHCALCRSYTD